MSTSYGIVGYPDVPRAEAAMTLDRCEAVLRHGGWIIGENDPEAVYAPKGRCFRPGPASGVATDVHDLPDGTVIMSINGIVFAGPRYLNHGPLTILPTFVCPACGTRMSGEYDSTGAAQSDLARTQLERCFELFSLYFEGDDPCRDVACVVCEAMVDVNTLLDDGAPTFILSDVAVEFWQWPPDKVDTAALELDAALGRKHLRGWVKV